MSQRLARALKAAYLKRELNRRGVKAWHDWKYRLRQSTPG